MKMQLKIHNLNKNVLQNLWRQKKKKKETASNIYNKYYYHTNGKLILLTFTSFWIPGQAFLLANKVVRSQDTIKPRHYL